MFNPPNSLSFLRAPLALLFIVENATLRAIVVFLAMLTDCVDGYLARRYRYTSRFGAILDPIMDKFFVYVVLAVLLYETRISPWKAAAMLTRDGALLLYMLYLRIRGSWELLEFKAIRWGKITTGTQFFFIIALALNISLPSFLYLSFVLFGILAFFELLYSSKIALAKQSSSQ